MKDSSTTDVLLVDGRQLGELLSLSPSYVFTLARAGRIPCVRIGPHAIRFEPDAVIAALKAAS
jgi:hypothetical protein